jgi:dTDP-4-dehydrorhamnose reductase
MNTHVIIGRGNLAIDLQLALIAAGDEAIIETRSTGFEWPKGLSKILTMNPGFVWVTAGFGSVEQCAMNLTGALATHVAMPLELAKNLPATTRLACFSSDYVADEEYPDQPGCWNDKPQSWYAQSKLWMELGLERMNRPLTATFRVSSLYGDHFPERTFPGKLRLGAPRMTHFTLPDNIVVPTPTWWLANRLVSDMDEVFSPKGSYLYHLAPSGGVSTLDWGRMILGYNYEITSRGLDPLRPAKSGLGCSYGPTIDWLDLWKESQWAR